MFIPMKILYQLVNSPYTPLWSSPTSAWDKSNNGDSHINREKIWKCNLKIKYALSSYFDQSPFIATKKLNVQNYIFNMVKSQQNIRLICGCSFDEPVITDEQRSKSIRNSLITFSPWNLLLRHSVWCRAAPWEAEGASPCCRGPVPVPAQGRSSEQDGKKDLAKQ